MKPPCRRVLYHASLCLGLLFTLSTAGTAPAVAADNLLVGTGGNGGNGDVGGGGGGGGIGGGGGNSSTLSGGGGGGIGGGGGAMCVIDASYPHGGTYSGGAGGSGATGGLGGGAFDMLGGQGGLGGGGGAGGSSGGGGALGGGGGGGYNVASLPGYPLDGGNAGSGGGSGGNGGDPDGGQGSLYGGGGGGYDFGLISGWFIEHGGFSSGGGGGGGSVVGGAGGSGGIGYQSNGGSGSGSGSPASIYTISTSATYGFVGVGGGGGGGSDAAGGAGTDGKLTVDGVTLTVNYSMLVGGAGGGAGNSNGTQTNSAGGSGGNGELWLKNGATVTVADTLLIGGSGGGGGVGYNSNGGGGGTGVVWVDGRSSIVIGRSLFIGGESGGNAIHIDTLGRHVTGTEGAGGKGGTGILNLQGSLSFGAGADFTIRSGSVFNVGGPTPGAADATFVAITGLPTVVTNDGDINFNQSAPSPYTFTANITGKGNVTQAGSGTTILTGNSDYSGTTTVIGGTLSIGSDNNIGTGTNTLAGGTLRLTGGGYSKNWTLGAGTNAIETPGDATMNGVLSGTGGFNKTGAGTLTLTGTNTYTGDTAVNAGTLKGGAANTFSPSSATTVNAGGTLDLGGYQQTIDTVTLAGGTIENGDLTGAITSSGGTVNGIGGAASLTTTAGITTLLGTNSYSGDTKVDGGTLKAGAANTFSPASDVEVGGSGTLDLNGFSQEVAGLSNAGLIKMGAAPVTVLTVNGNYAGQGGTIAMNTVLNDDSSPTDKMVVKGNVSGQTALDIHPAGGSGNVTVHGIEIVEVGGTSSSDSFALAGGKPSIPAGIYEYVLQKGGTAKTGESWYLVSAVNPNTKPVDPPVDPPVNPPSNPPSRSTLPASRPPELQPIYRPGATSYVAAQFLNAGQGFQQLYTLHQRVGEHRNLPEERQTWARTSYSTSQEDGKTRFGYDQDTIGLQIGQELIARRSGHATQRAALAFDYGYTKADFSDRIRPLVGLNEKTGEGRAEAWAFEGYFTQVYDGGAYFDIVGQAAALRNEYAIFESDGSRYKANQNGWRAGISGEAGYPLWQSDKWALEGHGQLSYQYASYADFEDRAAKKISDADAHSLRARLGTRLARELVKKEKRSLEAYGVVNLVADLIQPAGVDVQSNGYSVRISEDYDPLYGEIGAGVQGYVTGKISLFADFRYQHGFNSDNDRRGYAVNAGLRVGF